MDSRQTKPTSIHAICLLRTTRRMFQRAEFDKMRDSYDDIFFFMFFSLLKRKGSEPSLKFNLKIGQQCMY